MLEKKKENLACDPLRLLHHIDIILLFTRHILPIMYYRNILISRTDHINSYRGTVAGISSQQKESTGIISAAAEEKCWQCWCSQGVSKEPTVSPKRTWSPRPRELSMGSKGGRNIVSCSFLLFLPTPTSSQRKGRMLFRIFSL